MKAMLLAAGFGTRLKPFTNHHPKALVTVNNKSLLQRNIEYLQSFGIKEVVVNVHHFAQQIINSIKENNGWKSNVQISDETDAILETGGGLKRASWYLKGEENFVLMNCDILTDLDLNEMISDHLKNNSLATLATRNRQTSRYFLFDDENILCGWRNVKTDEEQIKRNKNGLHQKAFSGIHVINTNIFSLMNLKEEKFSMVDLYLDLCGENIIKSYDHSNTKFADVGKPESIVLAEKMFDT